LRIALLWHMHQPDYRHPQTGVAQMPWVRLHALQNYYDMARLVDEAPPGTKVSFNLTPVLLSQLEQIAEHGPNDRLHELCLRPVASLEPEERAFLVEHLFSTNEDRKIRPVTGYARLHRRAGAHRGPTGRTAAALGDQDLLDLQVFFHLAWTGRTLREDPFVQGLVARHEGGFTEDERDRLLNLQRAFLPRVLPLYKRLWQEGRIEVSTTPLHHPILPLLCDIRTAREGNPRSDLRDLDFRFPEDAAEQIRRGRALAQAQLGRLPEGMWPSEGSLSEEVLGILGAQGVRWVASDQHLLQRSLAHCGHNVDGPPHLRPWHLSRGEGPAMFFRDNELSDRIGFTYARWHAADAVGDLVHRSRSLLQSDPDPEQACLPIILDGENAWEFYEDHGEPFLAGLYRALAEADDLHTVTLSEALDQVPTRALPALRAGSWIGANLDTWVGHPEKNRAWAVLARARRALAVAARRDGMDDPRNSEAREHLLKAEASDWFWWLGDDHPTPYKSAFEQLFRIHVRAAWQAMGSSPPSEIEHSLLEPSARPARIAQPRCSIHPHIDGHDRRYYDWVGAGSYDARHQAAAIEVGRARFARMDFGFDAQLLYLRLVPAEPESARLGGAELRVLLLTGDEGRAVTVSSEPSGRLVDTRANGSDGATAMGSWAAARVIEIALDLEALAVEPGQSLGVAVEVFSSDGRVDRLPLDGTIDTQAPGTDFVARHWTTD
jgi:alpha-amylase/alpha-mannosidase (GH57 family)